MRTTLNIDDDVAAQLRDRAGREGRSISRVVNDLLRAGLGAEDRPTTRTVYEPPVLDTGRAALDVTDVASVLALLDEAT